MTESSRMGECFCGAIKFRVTLPSRFCVHCHCNNCRRAHSATPVTWAGFKKEQFEFVEGEEQVSRYTAPNKSIRGFCKNCGSTMFFESPRWAGEIHVTLTNILGEIDRTPAGHVYYDERNLPRFGGETGTEPIAAD